MRKAILAALLCMLTASYSFADFTSIYQAPTNFPIFSYDNKESCEEDSGTWQQVEGEEYGTCMFSASNLVYVVLRVDKVAKVAIETISTNAHTCHFESTNITELPNKNIIAKEGSCEVSINRNGDGSVSVSSNAQCRDFCGFRAYLGIDKAIKTK